MPSITRSFMLALAACSILCWAPMAAAQKVTLMTGGAAKIVYLPVVLASQLGYFRDEGLDVEILSQPAGVDTATELIAGAIQGAAGFYDHTIDLQSRGQDIEAVVVFYDAAGLVELASTKAAPHFMAMTDVRGRTLGVTGLGASTYFLTRYLAQRAGVGPNAYAVVPLGSESGFVTALGKGTVDAGMIEEPTASRLLADGTAHVVVDMRDRDGTRAALGGPYVGACLYMQRAWVAAHRDDTRHLVRALVRTLGFIKSHNAEQIAAVLPKDFSGVDRALYVKALAASIPSFSPDGRMPDGAPQTALAALAAVNPSIVPRHVDLGRTYTNTFADDAARSPNLASNPGASMAPAH
ncbi:ABC transporter substrate-binding protein [Paraburkholderia phosphatilytica]|uniref:ABC transporter substrate-binding protein n=1 Tax=Paraburkholderia phosphatilytica TaxID=2282883 RepID=UPI000E5574FC|nr:ABC transporter substrate-binding protein [Paraburkholderia phosphatilytica]